MCFSHVVLWVISGFDKGKERCIYPAEFKQPNSDFFLFLTSYVTQI